MDGQFIRWLTFEQRPHKNIYLFKKKKVCVDPKVGRHHILQFNFCVQMSIKNKKIFPVCKFVLI